MSDIFEQVLHHTEGTEKHTQEWQTADGVKIVETTTFGPERWIKRVHERGILSALDCVSLVFFALDDWSVHPSEDQERRLAEGWTAELLKAATSREITPRDTFTLLELPDAPEGWDWCLSMSDADAFVASRGMTWTCSEIATHLYDECNAAPTSSSSEPEGGSGDSGSGSKSEPLPGAPLPNTPRTTYMVSEHEVISAFGCGENVFKNAHKIDWVRRAKKLGRRGKNSIAPKYDPYAFATWLPGTEYGKHLTETEAWKLFRRHFPERYEEMSHYDPKNQ